MLDFDKKYRALSPFRVTWLTNAKGTLSENFKRRIVTELFVPVNNPKMQKTYV
jgi:hypothetical protein